MKLNIDAIETPTNVKLTEQHERNTHEAAAQRFQKTRPHPSGTKRVSRNATNKDKVPNKTQQSFTQDHAHGSCLLAPTTGFVP